ncbi:MAG: GNAT family N-acetyltransferase [Rhodospirillales bacterium]|nr:GNAT family N-acetyltransferase [Rhodospirillales bacterium]
MSVSPPGRIAIAQEPEPEGAARPEPDNVTVKAAHGIEEMTQALVVRAAVFLGEHDCPYAEEFDGNDCTATHFIGYVGDEPASACRVRYFADFARLERVAVRREFRGQAVGAKMIEFAHEFCRRKGYRKLHGQAEEHLVRFWEKFGWRRIDAPSFAYGGHRYLEIECDLEPHEEPITTDGDPMLFIRPEGAWQKPCLLERSTIRPVTEKADEGSEGDEWAAELKNRIKRLGSI